MVTDYERAWAQLIELLDGSERGQHGTQFLLAEMARIQARCRVNESGLPQALRVYGIEVAAGRARPDIRDVDPSLGGELTGNGAAAETVPAHGHRPHDELTEEVTDGSRHAAAAGVG